MFEGGQMPLIRRIPKRGFTNLSRVEYQVVNVRDLERVDGAVSPESLKIAGLIASLRKPVKILGLGEVAGAVSVSAHSFSKSARAKIEAAGGSVSVLGSE
jgi:large subunit ribosomal protein L15